MSFRLVIFLTLILGLAVIWAIGHRPEETLSYTVPEGFDAAVAIHKPEAKPFVSALEYGENLAPQVEEVLTPTAAIKPAVAKPSLLSRLKVFKKRVVLKRFHHHRGARITKTARHRLKATPKVALAGARR